MVVLKADTARLRSHFVVEERDEGPGLAHHGDGLVKEALPGIAWYPELSLAWPHAVASCTCHPVRFVRRIANRRIYTGT
jgi:hypothetical protein